MSVSLLRSPSPMVAVLISLLLTCLCLPAEAQSVSRKTYRELEDIQKLMEADQAQQAKDRLEALAVSTQNIPYDSAVVNQYLAHTSVMLQQPKRARSALEVALAVAELPIEMRTELNLFYGTVLLGEEEYQLARGALEEWIANAEFPKPSQVFSVAYANYKFGDMARAETLLKQAIDGHDKPPDSWLQVYYRVLFDLNKHKQAEALLHQLLARDATSKMLWRMLANHHLQLERNRDALAATMVAYINELVTEPNELKQLLSMFGYLNMPDRGARLLDELISSGQLEADADARRQLGNLWLMARERNNAKKALREAAKVAEDGGTYELLAGLYFEDENWSDAYTSFQDALRTGNLEKPMRVSLLAGISAMRAGLTEEAREALQVAAKSNQYKAEANGLLKQLDKQ